MTQRDPNWQKYEKRIGIAFVLNFVAFWVVGVFLRGDAINGHIKNGIYFLSSNGHDKQVHPLIWYYSATHASLVIGSFVLFFVYKITSSLIRHRASKSP